MAILTSSDRAALFTCPSNIGSQDGLGWLDEHHPDWRSDDPLVPTMWQAAGRDLDELPALFTKAQGL